MGISFGNGDMVVGDAGQGDSPERMNELGSPALFPTTEPRSVTVMTDIAKIWPTLVLDQPPLAESSKGVVLSGSLAGRPVVIKAGASHEWRSYFGNEIDCYELFKEHSPPLRVPELLDVCRDPAMIMLERLTGNSLGTSRYIRGDERVDFEDLLQILGTLRGFLRDRAPAVEVTEQRYRDRFDRYTKLGILTDQDNHFLESVLGEKIPAEFNHGDPLLTNVIQASGVLAFIDWEFGAWYLPLYDYAVLATVSVTAPEIQDAILDLVKTFDPSLQRSFLANSLAVASREVRTHTSLPDTVPIKANLPAISQWLTRVRQLSNEF